MVKKRWEARFLFDLRMDPFAWELQSSSRVYREEDQGEEALFIEFAEKQKKAKSLAVVSAI
jgi:hypothetical protein